MYHAIEFRLAGYADFEIPGGADREKARSGETRSGDVREGDVRPRIERGRHPMRPVQAAVRTAEEEIGRPIVAVGELDSVLVEGTHHAHRIPGLAHEHVVRAAGGGRLHCRRLGRAATRGQAGAPRGAPRDDVPVYRAGGAGELGGLPGHALVEVAPGEHELRAGHLVVVELHELEAGLTDERVDGTVEVAAAGETLLDAVEAVLPPGDVGLRELVVVGHRHRTLPRGRSGKRGGVGGGRGDAPDAPDEPRWDRGHVTERTSPPGRTRCTTRPPSSEIGDLT